MRTVVPACEVRTYLVLGVKVRRRRANEEHGGLSWPLLASKDSAMRIELWMEEAILGVRALQWSRQCRFNSSSLSSSLAWLSSASRAAAQAFVSLDAAFKLDRGAIYQLVELVLSIVLPLNDFVGR
ncbi:hypothetical protein ZIOFF_009332 [Zingiber officinale]|uniref:Uncharacterized protein n=1 Tax=Zingiber officinale TaxID=94328 RepID=A0A8J5LW56_ZINOF|nr:hypothetical protein ZIOFF_009332 [Zingiber officinale]